MSTNTAPIWQPSAQRIAATRLTAFMKAAGKRWNRRLAGADYSSLHAWSIDHPEEFWVSLWEFGGVIGEMGATVVVDREKMPGAKWFPEAKLNFAENLLRRQIEGDALVFWGEDKVKGRVSQAELHRAVAQTAAALRAMGVVKGDRVAAYLPNLPATVVAMLAAASDRRHLLLGLAGFRRAGRARPLRPDRAEGPVRLRRLLVQRQDQRLPRQGRRDRRRPAVAGARGRRALCGKCGRNRSRRQHHRDPPGRDAGGFPRSLRRPSARSASSGCPSTIRSTSCIPRAPPACPSASCIAPAACCCSTSRNTSCTAT
jgi:hypothetical protein